MNDFRKRRNLKREIPRVIVGCFGILALAALTFLGCRAAWDMYGKFAAASQARTDAETQLSQLKTQYDRVEEEVVELTTDRGVEAAVRERYGVAKPGEGEIDIVRSATSATSTDASQDPWLGKLWHSLFVW